MDTRTTKEKTRHGNHLVAVLARLQHGPALASDLFTVGGQNMRARVSELRQAGWLIEVRRGADGLNVYHLIGRRGDGEQMALGVG